MKANHYVGQKIRMMVPDKPINEPPHYVDRMIKIFKEFPYVEISRIEKNRIYVIDYKGEYRTIIPEWILDSDVVLFI